jgi:AraC family transcriptional regulator
MNTMQRLARAAGQAARGAEQFRAGPGDDWGTLGTPAGGSGPARLLHVVPSRSAVLRHAFYGAGAQVERHTHEWPELVYGVGGPCLEAAAVTTVSKRRLSYHPAGYTHALRYHGPTHVLAIELTGFDRETLPTETVPLPATLYGTVWAMLDAIVRDAGMDRVDEAIDLLAEGSRSAARQRPGWLPAVIDRIHENWERPPSAAALAKLAGVSTTYLCRSFKRLMGVTLQQYGLLLRLDKARGLLWGTALPLPDVAAETGFADQSHLTRSLAMLSNQTPLRLRMTAPCTPADDALLEPHA